MLNLWRTFEKNSKGFTNQPGIQMFAQGHVKFRFSHHQRYPLQKRNEDEKNQNQPTHIA